MLSSIVTSIPTSMRSISNSMFTITLSGMVCSMVYSTVNSIPYSRVNSMLNGLRNRALLATMILSGRCLEAVFYLPDEEGILRSPTSDASMVASAGSCMQVPLLACCASQSYSRCCSGARSARSSVKVCRHIIHQRLHCTTT